MDKTLITNFISQVNELMENNTKLSNLVISFQTEIFDLKNELEQTDKLNNSQIVLIDELNNKITKLTSDNNAKSSKSIWENTQQLIKEKDDEIDFLKKNIEFLKRQQTINPKQDVKPDVKQEVKLEAKQDAKPDVKPEVKPELKSEKPKKKEKLIVNTQNIVITNVEKEDKKIKNKVVLEKPIVSEIDDVDELERMLMM
jgi:hypothetical protein